MTKRNQKLPQVRYFIIATNQYSGFAVNLINSMASKLSLDDELNFTIFTNETDIVRSANRPRVNLEIVQISNLIWPEATLKRYELIANNISHHDEDIYCYIDADMLVCADLNQAIRDTISREQERFCVVWHPGYWRGRRENYLPIYSRDPKKMLSDAIIFLRMGALGSWETRRESEAYVTRKARTNYVAGGIWFASKIMYSKAVLELSNQVERDLNKSGIIAKWHDESYLNRWITQNPTLVLDPSWCYAEGYPFLQKLVPKVIAISKGQDFVRQ